MNIGGIRRQLQAIVADLEKIETADACPDIPLDCLPVSDATRKVLIAAGVGDVFTLLKLGPIGLLFLPNVGRKRADEIWSAIPKIDPHRWGTITERLRLIRSLGSNG